MDDEAEKFMGNEAVGEKKYVQEMYEKPCAETVQVKLEVKRKPSLGFVLRAVTSAGGPAADSLLNWSIR